MWLRGGSVNAAYTLRNAAEQFFAASAPVGFVGNSFSTFSKGIALMRAMDRARAQSPTRNLVVSEAVSEPPAYAYDCAPLEHKFWTMPRRRPSVSLAHPGFAHMQVLEPSRCGY